MLYLILFFLLFFKPNSTFSQDLVSQYQSDLSYQQDLYNQSHNIYLQKKTIHQQYQSISTEKELIDSIKTAIEYRNNLLSSYINLLIANLDTFKSIDPTQNTSSIQAALNQQNLWIKGQQSKVNAISNQSQLISYNQQFLENYKQIDQFINNALIQHNLNQQNQTIAQIKNLLLEIKASQEFDNQAQNWVSEIESQLNQSLIILSEASSEIILNKVETYRSSSDGYQNALPLLNSSKQNIGKIIDNIQNLINKFS